MLILSKIHCFSFSDSGESLQFFLSLQSLTKFSLYHATNKLSKFCMSFCFLLCETRSHYAALNGQRLASNWHFLKTQSFFENNFEKISETESEESGVWGSSSVIYKIPCPPGLHGSKPKPSLP